MVEDVLLYNCPKKKWELGQQQDCEVFTDEVMEYPPSAISLGEKTLNTKKGLKKVPIPIGTYGNISFVQAPS